MNVEGVVQQLHVQIQGHDLKVPAFLLHVFGADLILGIPWLASLGAKIADHSTARLKLYHEGKFITL